MRKKADAEKEKGGDLPHAASVQKWRADEPQAVVCYHGDSGIEGRNKQETPSVTWADHHPECLFFRCNCGGLLMWQNGPLKESRRGGEGHRNVQLLPLLAKHQLLCFSTVLDCK